MQTTVFVLCFFNTGFFINSPTILFSECLFYDLLPNYTIFFLICTAKDINIKEKFVGYDSLCVQLYQ